MDLSTAVVPNLGGHDPWGQGVTSWFQGSYRVSIYFLRCICTFSRNLQTSLAPGDRQPFESPSPKPHLCLLSHMVQNARSAYGISVVPSLQIHSWPCIPVHEEHNIGSPIRGHKPKWVGGRSAIFASYGVWLCSTCVTEVVGKGIALLTCSHARTSFVQVF